MDIKAKLLGNKIIWRINAAIKALKIETTYRYLKGHYEKKTDQNPPIPCFCGKWNILFIGTDERQDNTGFFQALVRQADYVIPFRTEDGAWGQYKLDEPERKKKNISRLKKILETAEKKIDCIIMQAWGSSFDIDEFLEIKKKYNLLVINIDLDSRLIFKKLPFFGKHNPGIFGVAKCADLVLVSTREIVDWYRKEGVAAIYFPLASSSEFYHPIKDVERIYDVGFIGSKYGLRGKEVEYLTRHGIKVEARGEGWPKGIIAYEENNYFFNQCKIVLGMGNISYCRNFFNPKLRDYDAPMSGSVYITNRTAELESDYVEDEEVLLFEDWSEAVYKIHELLKNEDRMSHIREAAYRAALERHSYENQISELFSMLMQRT